MLRFEVKIFLLLGGNAAAPPCGPTRQFHGARFAVVRVCRCICGVAFCGGGWGGASHCVKEEAAPDGILFFQRQDRLELPPYQRPEKRKKKLLECVTKLARVFCSCAERESYYLMSQMCIPLTFRALSSSALQRTTEGFEASNNFSFWMTRLSASKTCKHRISI